MSQEQNSLSTIRNYGFFINPDMQDSQLKAQEHREQFWQGAYYYANAERDSDCKAKCDDVFGKETVPVNDKNAAYFLGRAALHAQGFTGSPFQYFLQNKMQLPDEVIDEETARIYIGNEVIKKMQAAYDQKKKNDAVVSKVQDDLPVHLGNVVRGEYHYNNKDAAIASQDALAKIGAWDKLEPSINRARAAWAKVRGSFDSVDGMQELNDRKKLAEIAAMLSDENGKLDEVAADAFYSAIMLSAKDTQASRFDAMNPLEIHGLSAWETTENFINEHNDAKNDKRTIASQAATKLVAPLAALDPTELVALKATKLVTKLFTDEEKPSVINEFDPRVDLLRGYINAAMRTAISPPEQAGVLSKWAAYTGEFLGDSVIPMAGAMAATYLTKGAGGGLVAQAAAGWYGGFAVSKDAIIGQSVAQAYADGKENPEEYGYWAGLGQAAAENIAGTGTSAILSFKFFNRYIMKATAKATTSKALTHAAGRAMLAWTGSTLAEGSMELAEEEIGAALGSMFNSMARAAGTEMSEQHYNFMETLSKMPFHQKVSMYIFAGFLGLGGAAANYSEAQKMSLNINDMKAAGYSDEKARELVATGIEHASQLAEVYNSNATQEQKDVRIKELKEERLEYLGKTFRENVGKADGKELEERSVKQQAEFTYNMLLAAAIRSGLFEQALIDGGYISAIPEAGNKYLVSYLEKTEDGKGKLVTKEWTRDQLIGFMSFQNNTRMHYYLREIMGKFAATQFAEKVASAEELLIQLANLRDTPITELATIMQHKHITIDLFREFADREAANINADVEHGIPFEDAQRTKSQILPGVARQDVISLVERAEERYQNALDTDELKPSEIPAYPGVNIRTTDGKHIVAFMNGNITLAQMLEEMMEIRIKQLAKGNPETLNEIGKVLQQIQSKLSGVKLLPKDKTSFTESEIIEAFSHLAVAEVIANPEYIKHLNPSERAVVEDVLKNVYRAQHYNVIAGAWQNFKESEEGKAYLANGGKDLTAILGDAGFTFGKYFTAAEASAEQRVKFLEDYNFQPSFDEAVDQLSEQETAETELQEINAEQAKEPTVIPANESVTGEKLVIEPKEETQKEEVTYDNPLANEAAELQKKIDEKKVETEDFAKFFRKHNLTPAQAENLSIRPVNQDGTPSAMYTMGRLIAQSLNEENFSSYINGELSKKNLKKLLREARKEKPSFSIQAMESPLSAINEILDFEKNAPVLVELNSLSLRDSKGQEVMKKAIANHMKDHFAQQKTPKAEQEKIINEVNKRINEAIVTINEIAYSKDVGGEFETFTSWAEVEMDFLDDGNPLRSAFKKNGEYIFNIDLGTLCTKREALDLVMRELFDKGGIMNASATAIARLKDLLRSYDFGVACDLCFVESKRSRMLHDSIKTAFYWKSTLVAAGINDNLMVGERTKELSETQIARLKRLADNETYEAAFNEYMPLERRRSSIENEDLGITPTTAQKFAKLFLSNQALAGILDPGKLMHSRGLDELIRIGKGADVLSTLGGLYGAATAKPIEGFYPYHASSWQSSFDNKPLAKNIDLIYAIGGGRAQSFTDFNPMLFLDYVQLVADLEIRELPMHMYTKVASVVKLFGTSGIMFNMSLVPQVYNEVDAENLGFAPDGSFAWHDDSFPVNQAMELRKRVDFRGNVGIIAVSISDKHTLALLESEFCDMVIPFHKSGMQPHIQRVTGLDRAKDYTNVQNTRQADPTNKEKVKKFFFNQVCRHLINPQERLRYDKKIQAAYKLSIKRAIKNKQKKAREAKDFNEVSKAEQKRRLSAARKEAIASVQEAFNKTSEIVFIPNANPNRAPRVVIKSITTQYIDWVNANGLSHDARGAAALYTQWCKDNNYLGKFNDFENHRNYYKLLADFRCFDNDGTPVIQRPVRTQLTENWQQELRKALDEREDFETRKGIITGNTEKWAAEHADFTKRVKEIVQYRHAEGDIAIVLKERLESALGKDNVKILQNKPFLDAIEAAIAESEGAATAQERVQVWRNGDSVVYGFAYKGAIYLNEYCFNANTPAHEFTHVWANVLRKSGKNGNAVWKQGVDLLRQTDEWQEVLADSEYTNLEGNDDAIASEALARIVGKLNEDYIHNVLINPNRKPLKKDGIIARILKWLEVAWKTIRDTFSPIDNKTPLTLHEFSRMPLRDLWDTTRHSTFREYAAAVYAKTEEQERAEVQDSIRSAEDRVEMLVIGQNAKTWNKHKGFLFGKRPFVGRDDGKLRIEIDDSKSYINEKFAKENTTTTLDNILIHKEVFEAYPQLRDIVVSFKTFNEAGLKGVAFDKQIEISNTLLNDIESVKSTLLHEVQHHIQEIEGFSSGGNETLGWYVIQGIEFDYRTEYDERIRQTKYKFVQSLRELKKRLQEVVTIYENNKSLLDKPAPERPVFEDVERISFDSITPVPEYDSDSMSFSEWGRLMDERSKKIEELEEEYKHKRAAADARYQEAQKEYDDYDDKRSEIFGVLSKYCDILLPFQINVPSDIKDFVKECEINPTPFTSAIEMVNEAKEKLALFSDSTINKLEQEVETEKKNIEEKEKFIKKAKENNKSVIAKLGYNSRAERYYAYSRFSGEIEARNVQKRMDMTARERKHTPFNKTLEYEGENLFAEPVFQNFSIQALDPSEHFSGSALAEQMSSFIRKESRRLVRVLNSKTPYEDAVKAVADARAIIHAVDKYVENGQFKFPRYAKARLNHLRRLIDKYYPIIAQGKTRSFVKLDPSEEAALKEELNKAAELIASEDVVDTSSEEMAALREQVEAEKMPELYSKHARALADDVAKSRYSTPAEISKRMKALAQAAKSGFTNQGLTNEDLQESGYNSRPDASKRRPDASKRRAALKKYAEAKLAELKKAEDANRKKFEKDKTQKLSALHRIMNEGRIADNTTLGEAEQRQLTELVENEARDAIEKEARNRELKLTRDKIQQDAKERNERMVRMAATGRVGELLGEMLDETSNIIDAYLKEELRQKLLRVTNAVKIKRTPSKRLKGKMNAASYRRLEEITKLMEMSTRAKNTVLGDIEVVRKMMESGSIPPKEINDTFEQIIEALERNKQTIDIASVHMALNAKEVDVMTFGDFDSMTYRQAKAAANAVATLLAYGRTVWEAKTSQETAAVKAYLEYFLDNTTKEMGKDSVMQEAARKLESWITFLPNSAMNTAQLFLALSSYEPLKPIMDNMRYKLATAVVARDLHIQNIRRNELAEFGRIIGMVPDTKAGYSDKQIKKLQGKFDDFFIKNNEVHDTGIIPEGRETPLRYTNWELLSLILTYRQPHYQVNAEEHGFTLEVLDKMREHIGEDIMTFGNFIQQAIVNDGTIAVYEEREGIPMPDNPLYYPGNININTLNVTREEPLTNPYKPAAMHDFLHVRVKNKEEIKAQNAYLVYRHAIDDRSNYVYLDPVTTPMNRLLAHKEFSNRLLSLVGPSLVSQLKTTLKEIQGASRQESAIYDLAGKGLAGMLGAHALMVLPFNPGTYFRQTSAVANAGLMPGISPVAYAKYAIITEAGLGVMKPSDVRKLDVFKTRKRDDSFVNEPAATERDAKPSKLLLPSKKGMLGIDWMDTESNSHSAAIIYNYTYDKLKAAGSMSEDEIRQRCEEEVNAYIRLLAQPFHRMDKSALYWAISQSAVGRAILYLSSESLNKIGMMRANYIVKRNSGKSANRAGWETVWKGMMTVGFATFLIETIIAALMGNTPDDEDDSWFAWIIATMLQAGIGQHLETLPLIGAFTRQLFSPYAKLNNDPLNIPGNDLTKYSKLHKMLTDDKKYSEAEWTKAISNFMKEFVSLLGLAGGAYSPYKALSGTTAALQSISAAMNTPTFITRVVDAHFSDDKKKKKKRRMKSLVEEALTPEPEKKRKSK